MIMIRTLRRRRDQALTSLTTLSQEDEEEEEEEAERPDYRKGRKVASPGVPTSPFKDGSAEAAAHHKRKVSSAHKSRY